MVLTLENSDYFLQYAYLKNRLDFYFVGFQTANFFNVGMYSGQRLDIMDFKHNTHPFSKFQRLDYGLSVHNINYSILEPYVDIWGQTQYDTRQQTDYAAVLPSISWVYDNSAFGFTGPIDGFRKIQPSQ